tara:strand:- start:579 stop:1571 length:993 start_codon:yes stop_codon:yes gene_type:complete
MKALLIGYYGYGNVGDDILLDKTIFLVEKMLRSKRIWILSAKGNSYRYAINRWNPFMVIKTIFSVDILVFGGGGLLQNTTSNFSLFYYLSFIFFAKFFNKKIVLLAQGIGPIRGFMAKLFVRIALDCVSKITIRSKEVSEYVSLGNRVKLSSDLAFYQASGFFPRESISTNTVGVNFCQIKEQKQYAFLVSEIRNLGFHVSGLSFCQSVDTQLLIDSGIQNNDIKEVSASSYYKASNIHYNCMLVMRYHGCIWASLQGIPFIAIAYDDKVFQLATLMKQPVLTMEELTLPSSFKQLITSITSNFCFYQDNIVKSRDRLLELSRLNEWVFT